MNILFKVTCVLVFMGLISPTIGNAQTIIQNDAVLSPSQDPFFGDYDLFLSQSIPDGLGLFLYNITELSNSQFRFDFSSIAELNALYQVTPGQIVSAGFANSTTPFVTNSNNPGTGVLSLAVGESVFLGYWDDRTFESLPDSDDNYGWFELSNTGAGLELLGGATVIGFEGIIVGTTTAVPEPSSATLVLGMISATMLRRRRA